MFGGLESAFKGARGLQPVVRFSRARKIRENTCRRGFSARAAYLLPTASQNQTHLARVSYGDAASERPGSGCCRFQRFGTHVYRDRQRRTVYALTHWRKTHDNAPQHREDQVSGPRRDSGAARRRNLGRFGFSVTLRNTESPDLREALTVYPKTMSKCQTSPSCTTRLWAPRCPLEA